MKIAGIYKVTNNITGDFYIGSSQNIKQRWASHKNPAFWKQHPNVKLYQDMAQYGRDNFTIDVIEETADLKEREQYWIDKLKPSYNSRYAKGCDTERYKEAHKRCSKEWHEIHRNERLAYYKAYRRAHRDKDLAKKKANYSRLCFYEGETLTLAALSKRLCRQGILHPTLEAKKYLIERSL